MPNPAPSGRDSKPPTGSGAPERPATAAPTSSADRTNRAGGSVATAVTPPPRAAVGGRSRSRTAAPAAPPRAARAAARPTGRPHAAGAQDLVGLGQLARRHPDAPVLDRHQLRTGRRTAVARLRTTTVTPGGEKWTAFSRQLGEQVGEVGDAAPGDRQRLVDRLVDPVEVLDLGDGRPHDVGEPHRLPPGPRRLLSGEHEEVLRVAADAGGEVVEPEQVVQGVRVALLLLEVVEQVELPVEQGLVAPGQVHQELGGEPAPADLGVGQLRGQPERAVLLVLGVLPEQHHADAGGQHGDAVDSDHSHGCCWAEVWLNIRSGTKLEPIPWLSTVNTMSSRNGTQS